MSGVSVFPDHSHEKGSSQKKKKIMKRKRKDSTQISLKIAKALISSSYLA
jgi:hypothetical protein